MNSKKPKLNNCIRISIIFFLLIYLLSDVSAQENKKVRVAIEPVKMNILYIGVPNRVYIASFGKKSSEISVSVNNGTITGSIGNYILIPAKLGTVIITVSDSNEALREIEFRVIEIPTPKISINGNYGGDISKELLLAADSITAEDPYGIVDFKYEIVSFEVSVNGLDSWPKSKSNTFTKQQKDLIRLVSPGGNVYLEQIKYRTVDGKTKNASSIKFRLK